MVSSLAAQPSHRVVNRGSAVRLTRPPVFVVLAAVLVLHRSTDAQITPVQLLPHGQQLRVHRSQFLLAAPVLSSDCSPRPSPPTSARFSGLPTSSDKAPMQRCSRRVPMHDPRLGFAARVELATPVVHTLPELDEVPPERFASCTIMYWSATRTDLEQGLSFCSVCIHAQIGCRDGMPMLRRSWRHVAHGPHLLRCRVHCPLRNPFRLWLSYPRALHDFWLGSASPHFPSVGVQMPARCRS